MELRFRERSKFNWTPTSYTANATPATPPLTICQAGDFVGPVFCRVRVVFNGGGTDAIITLGDTGDADRFLADGNADETTTGLYRGQGGSGSVYAALGNHLYTAATSISVTFTANTSGTRTTGTVDWWLYVARVNPY